MKSKQKQSQKTLMLYAKNDNELIRMYLVVMNLLDSNKRDDAIDLLLQQKIMKKQLEQDRQKLIGHIQDHLAILRKKRKQLQSTNIQQPARESYTYIPNTATVHRQKHDLQVKLHNLGQLYATKKQLENVGINVQSHAEIAKYKSDHIFQQKVQQKKLEYQTECERRKIIDEQLANTKKFLASKHKINLEKKQLQVMNYRKLFKDKTQQLKQYEGLLYKDKLSRMDKQRLISMSFKLICDWNKLVHKKYMKQFLLANPQFTTRFIITTADINRDLQVFETKQEGYLDELEFYQYVKSNEITNGTMKPSLKNKAVRKKVENEAFSEKITDQILIKIEKNDEESIEDRRVQRKHVDYLRKVFNQVDRFKEGVVERCKYVGYLDKKWNIGKQKNIQGKIIEQFVNFINAETNKKKKSTYYQELQSKFISFQKVDFLFREMIKALFTSKNPPLQMQQQQHTLSHRQEPQTQLLDESQPQQPDRKEQTNDFIKYGWKNQQNTQQIGLADLDQYYSKIREKHGAEIEWNSFQHYSANFNELQAFIQAQQAKQKAQRNNLTYK